MELVPSDVVPNQESDAADDNQHRHDAVYKDGIGICCQRGEGRPRAHQVKACVAKCRNSVEEAEPYAFPHAKARDKHRRERQSAEKLKKQCHLQDIARQPHDPADVRRREYLLHGASLPETDFLAGHQGDGEGCGDQTQTAELDQQQDHDLPEDGPGLRGGPNHQPGYTGRRGRRKQGVEAADAFSASRAERETQQQGPNQNQGSKA